MPTIITTGMGTVPVKAAGDTVELTVSDDSAKYAGYETHKMYAGGNYPRPMFGGRSSQESWDKTNMAYMKVHICGKIRTKKFLKKFCN